MNTSEILSRIPEPFNIFLPIDCQIINDTRLAGEIRVSRTVSYVVEDFD